MRERAKRRRLERDPAPGAPAGQHRWKVRVVPNARPLVLVVVAEHACKRRDSDRWNLLAERAAVERGRVVGPEVGVEVERAEAWRVHPAAPSPWWVGGSGVEPAPTLAAEAVRFAGRCWRGVPGWCGVPAVGLVARHEAWWRSSSRSRAQCWRFGLAALTPEDVGTLGRTTHAAAEERARRGGGRRRSLWLAPERRVRVGRPCTSSADGEQALVERIRFLCLGRLTPFGRRRQPVLALSGVGRRRVLGCGYASRVA